MKILVINSCIHEAPRSRTARLCNAYLEKLQKQMPNCQIKTLCLREEKIEPLYTEALDLREELAAKKQWEDPLFTYAKELLTADRIVIAAPYWDVSFPAMLKAYLERLCVNGLTFCYDGPKLVGLCHAKDTMYLSTMGGFLNGAPHLGAEYVKSFFEMLGIFGFDSVTAEGLDIVGVDVEAQMQKALAELAKKP